MKTQFRWIALFAVSAALGAACGEDASTKTTITPLDSAGGTDVAADSTKTDTIKTDIPKADIAKGGTWTPANACWKEKCPDEFAACEDDQGCLDFVDCVELGQQTDEGCVGEIPDESKELFQAAVNCGYTSCADPNGASCKGQCGNFLGDESPCNCDEACANYGDCCSDYEAECTTPGPTSCQDRCDSEPVNNGCNCDADCTQYDDCCEDYQTLCVAPQTDTVGGDGSSSEDATTYPDTSSTDATIDDVQAASDATATGG